jgi:hypothetical protein
VERRMGRGGRLRKRRGVMDWGGKPPPLPFFFAWIQIQCQQKTTCTANICFFTPQLTPNMIDSCSFQEPLGRLVKKGLHIDFYQFYDKGNYLEDPSEEDLKTYNKNDMFPLRPCKFMGMDSFCPNKPWKLLKIYFHADNSASKYKCKNKAWVDKNGKSAF